MDRKRFYLPLWDQATTREECDCEYQSSSSVCDGIIDPQSSTKQKQYGGGELQKTRLDCNTNRRCNQRSRPYLFTLKVRMQSCGRLQCVTVSKAARYVQLRLTTDVKKTIVTCVYKPEGNSVTMLECTTRIHTQSVGNNQTISLDGILIPVKGNSLASSTFKP